MANSDSEADSNIGLMKEPAFWVAQLLACGLIVILGLAIWYVQT
jgi:hypothetical protein